MSCWSWGWTVNTLRVPPPSHHLGPGGRGRGDSTFPLSHCVGITPYGATGWRSERGLEYARAGTHVLLPARKPADCARKPADWKIEENFVFFFISELSCNIQEGVSFFYYGV